MSDDAVILLDVEINDLLLERLAGAGTIFVAIMFYLQEILKVVV